VIHQLGRPPAADGSGFRFGHQAFHAQAEDGPKRPCTGSSGRNLLDTANVIDVTGVHGKRKDEFSCKEFESWYSVT
jgi:hypothetical protein